MPWRWSWACWCCWPASFGNRDGFRDFNACSIARDIFLPLAGALLIWTVGGRNQAFCRQSAAVSAVLTLVLAGDPVDQLHARCRALRGLVVCLARSCLADRRAVQRRTRRAQPVAVRPDGAARVDVGADQLGVDHRSAGDLLRSDAACWRRACWASLPPATSSCSTSFSNSHSFRSSS